MNCPHCNGVPPQHQVGCSLRASPQPAFDLKTFIWEAGIDEADVEDYAQKLKKVRKQEDLAFVTEVRLEKLGIDLIDAAKLEVKAQEKLGRSVASGLSAQQQPVRKCFRIGDAVREADTYSVPFNMLQLGALVTAIEKEQFALVAGSFRSGKSSHLQALKEHYSGSQRSLILDFTLDAENFWETITLYAHQQVATTREIKSPADFTTFLLDDVVPNLGECKKVVFLFDEFQILQANQERDRFIRMIKRWRDERARTRVQAVLAFGTYSILHWQSSGGQNPFDSPFPATNTVYIQPLPSRGIRLMFQEWANDRHITISPHVVYSIEGHTAGYAGLVGLVGGLLDALDRCALPLYSELSVTRWFTILARVPSEMTMVDQFKRLKKKVHAVPELSTIILQKILPHPGPYRFSGEDWDFACELANIGVLRYLPPAATMGGATDMFELSAPLMRQLLAQDCYLPKHPLTLNEECLSDIPALLQLTVPEFSPKVLANELCHNKARHNFFSFPSEYILQAELFAIIRSSLLNSHLTSPSWIVLLEARNPLGGNSRQRADIIICNGKRTLLELKSNEDLSGACLQKVTEQASRYAHAMLCDNVAVVNFVPDTRKVTVYPYEDGNPHCHQVDVGAATISVMIIQYCASADFTQWKLLKKD